MLKLLSCLLLSGPLAGATPLSAQFSARRDYFPGAQLVRSADINGDKIPDIVGVSGLYSTATALMGQGNGSFTPGPVSSIGFQGVGGMALQDLNGDGKVDLIVSGYIATGANGIGVCFGNGDGSFQASIFYQVADPSVEDLVLADVNGDGIADAAIAGENGIWLFLGKGGGAFSPGVLIPAPAGDTIGFGGGRLAAADFNADGHLDLAITYNSTVPNTPSGFAVLFGNGDGTFQPAVSHQLAPRGAENYIAIGDLNRDGHPDIVLSPIKSGVCVCQCPAQ